MAKYRWSTSDRLPKKVLLSESQNILDEFSYTPRDSNPEPTD
jgi:hypothetical protein